jgi:hypothetical protein
MSDNIVRPSRQDYLNGIVAQSEYYQGVAADVGFENDFLQRLRGMVKKQTSMKLWDELANANGSKIGKALELHGDHFSVSAGSKVLIAAANLPF